MTHPVIPSIRTLLYENGLLPLRSQAELSENLLQERLDLLPSLLEETQLDCWLVVAHENNEDPVMKSLMTWDRRTARRLTALLFFRNGRGGVDRLSWGMPSQRMAQFYTPCKQGDESLCQGLVRLFEQYDPQRIGINVSPACGGFCDGLSAGLYQTLQELPEPYRGRLCSAERLSTRFLETMTARELHVMGVLVKATEAVIQAAYSPSVIQPGVTTTQDVEWFMRDVISQCELDFWFGPDVDLQRQGLEGYSHSGLIQPGDLLHCDIGVYLKYIPVLTDKQWMAYVAKPGETQAPAGLQALFAQGNQFQDITRSVYLPGRTGNAVFHDAVEKGKAAGLLPELYCHGLGTFGHGAGPIIGRYDYQDSIYPRGELPLGMHTSYALELNVRGPVPEWQCQMVRISLEEDIHVAQQADYVYNHQQQLIVIA